MIERIQAIRGMNDILTEECVKWQYLEKVCSDCLKDYGYGEIRFPVVENTMLFKRTIGEITDIVEKEMYTFMDLNGDSLTLRPEGTASCVRACLEHGLLHHQQQKLWYMGPMFRHEKPQKGRYRQFHQIGVEAFGISGIGIELELLMLCQRLWEKLRLSDAMTLELNTLGTLEERRHYRGVLVDFLKAHFHDLDPDSQRRLERNPLRILDSKHPKTQSIIAKAPRLLDVLEKESRMHFNRLCQGLEKLGIPFRVNPCLVRGLDYYGHTVFEWVTDQLGSQATLCAGGRYDALVEHLGGESTPAIGFAMGLERLLLLMETLMVLPSLDTAPVLFLMAMGETALIHALKLADTWRKEVPHYPIVVNTVGGSFKSQFKKADKSGARLALILGDEELEHHTISVKDLREETEQVCISQETAMDYIKTYLQ